MPRKPKRPCSYPGCPKLVEGQYCDKHKKLTDSQYNKYGRDEFTKSFYMHICIYKYRETYAIDIHIYRHIERHMYIWR